MIVRNGFALRLAFLTWLQGGEGEHREISIAVVKPEGANRGIA